MKKEKISNISCIYKIVNIINNKYYIGSSIKVRDRWTKHLSNLRNNNHHSPYLQNSFNKHGEDNFKIEIIELVDINSLNSREEYWINRLDACNRIKGYNNENIVNGIRIFSEETKEKLRKTKSTKEYIEKNIKHLNNIRLKANNNRNIPITKYSKNKEFIKEYKSITEAAKENNVEISNIWKVLKGRLITTGNYIWKYKDAN